MKCFSLRSLALPAMVSMVLFSMLATSSAAEPVPVVPGTGVLLDTVGDDFEDPEWNYVMNGRKASREQNNQVSRPTGYSENRRWMESPKRGQPDLIRRVPTPEGGIEGSEGSLLMRSLQTGVPGRASYRNQQDDLLLNIMGPLRGATPVYRTPSLVVRVYVPPFEEFENRTGTSFGLRAGCRASNPRPRQDDEDPSAYWPGFFIEFHSETDQRHEADEAFLRLRADRRGRDFMGPQLKEATWYTLGMSFTRDGMVHYYYHEGVEDLAAEDYITSQYPYGFRCARFNTFFFNVANGDNGRDWSTPWIIDDPRMYVVQAVAQRAPSQQRTNHSNTRRSR